MPEEQSPAWWCAILGYSHCHWGRASVVGGHCPCQFRLWQAASSASRSGLALGKLKEAAMCGGFTRELCGEGDSWKSKEWIGDKRNAARGPAVTAEALATIRGLPAAPAVDNAGFDPSIILPGAGKVGVEVLDLDQPQGDMFGHFV